MGQFRDRHPSRLARRSDGRRRGPAVDRRDAWRRGARTSPPQAATPRTVTSHRRMTRCGRLGEAPLDVVERRPEVLPRGDEPLPRRARRSRLRAGERPHVCQARVPEAFSWVHGYERVSRVEPRNSTMGAAPPETRSGRAPAPGPRRQCARARGTLRRCRARAVMRPPRGAGAARRRGVSGATLSAGPSPPPCPGRSVLG